MNQVAIGKAHLAVAKGLAASDPVVLNAARTFFAMTIDSHVYSAQMHAARLHDATRGTVTVKTLLQRAEQEAGTAQYGSPSDVREAISYSQRILSILGKPLYRLINRRNVWLAHNDPRTLTDPQKMAAMASPTFRDLRWIFAGTGRIVNEFSRLYRDVTGILDLVSLDDYETVIEFVSRVKCQQLKSYEAEFNEPPPFPRPRGCE